MNSKLTPDGRSARFWAIIAALIAILGIVVPIMTQKSEGGNSPDASEKSPSPSKLVAPSVSESRDNATSAHVQYLAEFDSIEGYARKEAESVNGHDHPYSLTMFIDNCGPGTEAEVYEVNIQRQWRRFKATLFLSSDTLTNVRVRFTVQMDGKIKGKEYDVGVDREVPINVDASNVARLRLKVIATKGEEGKCNIGSAVWGDARVTT